MKIAFVTDDGQTITPHFGRATHYLIVELENGEIKERLMVPKFLHHTTNHDHNAPHDENEMSHENKHALMFKSIEDCDLLVANGMGYSVKEAAAVYNISVITTGERHIELALQLYLAGSLENNERLVH